MIASPFLLAALLLPAGTVAPSLTADLDGDGRTETVTAAPARGSVRLEVRDPGGRRLADAKAPAPAGDVVPVTLTTGPLGSAGALVEVLAATDASECRTFWRYRDGALTKLPLRDASGRPLPDCAPPAGWTAAWEPSSGGLATAWVRERTRTVDSGALSTREAYVFAGFSLDFDAARSAAQLEGIPIPAWYAATLYPRDALAVLYSRFRLGALRGEPTLRIDADRARGIFALRFTGPKGAVVAPIGSYAADADTATLVAEARGKEVRAKIHLGGGGTVPMSVVIDGLGPDWDRSYAPAAAWRGGARHVFPNAADELASQYLPGAWSGPRGAPHTLTLEAGGPPYRVRDAQASYRVDIDAAVPPFDALLLPPSGRAWGLILQGPNRFDRVPVVCAGSECRTDGEPEIFRRIGARVNTQ